jgi:tetratricopeptide (TPR) repeat protein
MIVGGAVLGLALLAGVGIAVLDRRGQTRGLQEGPGTPGPAPQVPGTPAEQDEQARLTPEQRAAALKEEELRTAEALVKAFPDSEQPLVLLGDVHHRRGSTDLSTSLWEKALQMNPRRPDVLDRLARFAHDMDDYTKAVDLWRRALAIDPNLEGAHLGMAQSMMTAGKYEDALGEIRQEISIAPDKVVCYYLLGQAFQHLQDYENARLNYEKAVAMQPAYASARYGLYTIYTRLKEPERAGQQLAEFERLRDRDVQRVREADLLRTDLDAFAKNVAGLCVAAYKLYEPTRDETRKEQLLTRAVALDPQNARTRERLAVLYGMQGRGAEALALLRRIEQVEPNNAACQYNLARVSIQMGRREDAEKALQRFIALEPNHYAGYQELARLYLRTKVNLPRARQLAQKAVSLGPVAESYFLLGWACYANQDDAAAKVALEKAMSLDPQNAAYARCYRTVLARGEVK